MTVQITDEWTDLEEIDLLVSLADVRRFLRRYALLILSCALMGLVLGSFFLLRSTPLYGSTVVVSAERGRNFELSALPLFGEPEVDDVWLLTQAEMIVSDLIVSSVIDELGLTRDPRVSAAGQTYLDYLQGENLSQTVPDTAVEEMPKWLLIRMIQQSTAVEVVQADGILRITHYAAYPDLAADVASALANAFAADGFASKIESAALANHWIQSRAIELQKSVQRADEAIQRFRALNNLQEIKGVPLIQAELREITEALAAAKASLSRSEAKYDSITHAMESGDSQAIVAEALRDTNSTELRRRYLEAQRFATEFSKSQGEAHLQSQRYREEMRAIETMMADELARISQAIKSQVQVERNRVEALRTEFEKVVQEAGSAGVEEITLSELQREYSALDKVYRDFLARYQETILKSPVPVNGAAVVSPARIPGEPAFPNPPFILTATTLLGFALGGAMGAFLQLRDRSIRDVSFAEQGFDVDQIGRLPNFGRRPRWRRRSHSSGLHLHNGKLSFALENPFSEFAETLRRAYLFARGQPHSPVGRVIGITSAVPREGKSTVAINLALLAASEGKRVLLVDAATQKKSIAAKIAPGETFASAGDLADLVLRDQGTGLHFLSLRSFTAEAGSSLSNALQRCFSVLSASPQTYDLVVVDMPDISSLGYKAEAFAFIPKIILILAARSTARRAVLRILTESSYLKARSVGVIMNDL